MPIRHLSELNPYDNNRLKSPDSVGAGTDKNPLTVKSENPTAPTKSLRSFVKKARALYPSEAQPISPKTRPT